jgi:tetratricopeptide (TPR) repeat protein
LETVAFNALGAATRAEPEEPPWFAAMQRSYQAWEARDLQAAHDALKAVIDEFPDVPEAHNNLGFVLLVLGRPVEALAECNRAVELDFERPEIVLANLAACYYILGDTDQAFARFKYCLTRVTFIEGAWLLGLNGKNTFLQDLQTGVDYVDLMTLNLAWAAHRRGDLAEARRGVGRAAVSSLRVEGSEFAMSVEHLSRTLGSPKSAGRT